MPKRNTYTIKFPEKKMTAAMKKMTGLFLLQHMQRIFSEKRFGACFLGEERGIQVKEVRPFPSTVN